MSYNVHKVFIAISYWLLAISCFGQNKEFVKKNFRDNVKGYHKAMDSIKKGDTYYTLGIHNYCYAVPYYLSAEKFNPDNDMLNYKIGKCMLYSSLKNQASAYLERAIKLNPLTTPDAHYYLARAYHLNMDWDKAKQEYNTYLQTLPPDKIAEIADARKKMEECDNGKALSQSPVRVNIDNLGTSVNTKYPEYHPLVTADESKIFFTSRKPIGSKDKTDPADGENYESIFESDFKNGIWSASVNIGSPVDTKSHTATAGLSLDGQTLYIYRTNDNGDLYQAHFANNGWSKPQRMNRQVNSDSKETSATVSADGKILYFVSDRPGGYGMGDIYKVVSDGQGNWSAAQNIGPVINTQYDEQGVFLSPDGSTLYFSSTGHNTMGGYDIFKSVNTNGQWSAPENLGYPINTPDDDVFFTMPANSKHAYYSSCQKNGMGDMDIYMITFLGAEKPVISSNAPNILSGITSNITDVMMGDTVSVEVPKVEVLKVEVSKKALLHGLVVDSETHKPLFASIELVDNKKNQSIANFKTDSVTGKYEVSLAPGVNYAIAVKAGNYLFFSGNIDLTDTLRNHEIEKNIALQPLKKGSHIALRNIFFDYNKATLNDESKPELQRVIDLLNQNPTITIEIAGYTDNTGLASYNLTLSAERAKSVVDYLVAHGISANRLVSKGYGAANPVATNATDEGRKQNRRTEFKITGK